MFGKKKEMGKMSTVTNIIGSLGEVTMRPFVSCKEEPEAGQTALLTIKDDKVIRTSVVQKTLTDGNGHWVILTKNSIYMNF